MEKQSCQLCHWMLLKIAGCRTFARTRMVFWLTTTKKMADDDHRKFRQENDITDDLNSTDDEDIVIVPKVPAMRSAIKPSDTVPSNATQATEEPTTASLEQDRDDSCRVYVGNLSYSTSWQNLKDHMKRGEMNKIIVFHSHNSLLFVCFFFFTALCENKQVIILLLLLLLLTSVQQQ
jgi:hypothetical protein